MHAPHAQVMLLALQQEGLANGYLWPIDFLLPHAAWESAASRLAEPAAAAAVTSAGQFVRD